MKKLLTTVYRVLYVWGGAIIAYYGIYWATYSLYYEIKGRAQ